jgi:hypothetical protein
MFLNNSNIERKLESDQLGIQGSRWLPNDENGKGMPFVIVGDAALALPEHVLRPYPNSTLTVQQRICNYGLTRARRMAECAFGILANKWRIFQRPLDVTPQFCDTTSAFEDGTDRGFRNVGIYTPDAGITLKKIYYTIGKACCIFHSCYRAAAAS